jgi:demethylmenaquinone methyltransferase/2-methoxy-6-polyprenyl-1,4-benzoquinol methylase
MTQAKAMTTGNRLELVERFFSGTGSTYDRIVNWCTLGFDKWWKRKILAKIPENPRLIIDQACGTGILTFKIAQRFPHCRLIGVELRDEYLDIAREKARRLHLNNLEFVTARAEDLVLAGSFDCITSSYLAKYAEIDCLVANAKRMLREGGLLIMHDFTYPPGPLFARLWEFYFTLMRAWGNRRYPQWNTVFHELPVFLRQTRWVSELTGCLRKENFSSVSSESLTFGTAAIVTAQK